MENDKLRKNELNLLGYKILLFTNEQILKDVFQVTKKIKEFIKTL